MTSDELLYYCKNGALKLGIRLTDEQGELFERYYKLILRRNDEVNLTAILDKKEFAIKHFIDSLTCLFVMPVRKNIMVVDIGTGPGLPGIPLKIIRPDIFLTLVDSSVKKVKFLKEIVLYLGLMNVNIIHARAEELSHWKGLRESFDCVVCRAVASLPVVIEYCLGLVKVGGVMVALKGPAALIEEKTCKRALSVMGGIFCEVKEFTLPFLNHKRRLIVIKKITATPGKYPRRSGVPAKRPL